MVIYIPNYTVKIKSKLQSNFLSSCEKELGSVLVKEQRATNVVLQIKLVESLKVNRIISQNLSKLNFNSGDVRFCSTLYYIAYTV